MGELGLGGIGTALEEGLGTDGQVLFVLMVRPSIEAMAIDEAATCCCWRMSAAWVMAVDPITVPTTPTTATASATAAPGRGVHAGDAGLLGPTRWLPARLPVSCPRRLVAVDARGPGRPAGEVSDVGPRPEQRRVDCSCIATIPVGPMRY